MFKNKTHLAIALTLAFMMLVGIFAQVTAHPDTTVAWSEECPSGHIEINGTTVVCFADEIEQPTPTTEINTPTPTFTSIIPPTDTPTPPPTGDIDPYPGAPACAVHDDRAYHTLWNATDGCHYDHQHGDDPRALDDILGVEVYDLMGGEISYPWHTSGENESIKHKSYMWFVETDFDTCFNRYGDGCLAVFRTFVHTDLHNVTSTHHSALVEGLVCAEPAPGETTDMETCGYVLISGHQTTGDLFIDQQRVLDGIEHERAPRAVMLHYDQEGSNSCATWYPTYYAWMRVSTEMCDMWGYYPMPDVIPAQAEDLEFVRLDGNGSRQQPHVVLVGVPGPVLRSGIMGTDILDYEGFINVHTGELDTCTEIGEHCAPIRYNGVRSDLVNQTQFRGEYREYDIFFGNQSSNWLTFPGFVP